MDLVRKLFICLAATFAAGLLFVNIYNSVVDTPNWGGNIPASIQASRDYFRFATPATFYRVISPLGQILTLLALILCWTADRRVRYFLLAALVLAVAADPLTFGYFYPRNKIMFIDPIEGNVAAIRSAFAQWATVNWIRSAVVAAGLLFDFAALTQFLSLRK
jgi:hypothetical protein